jgi:hypothetical protein
LHEQHASFSHASSHFSRPSSTRRSVSCHPTTNPEVGDDDTTLWIALHAAPLVLIGGMAVMG